MALKGLRSLFAGAPREAELLAEIDRWLEEVWFPPDSDQQRGISGGRYLLTSGSGHDDRARLDESLRRLRARWSLDALGATSARLYFDPIPWQPGRENVRRLRAVVAILEAAVILHPPPDLAPLIERRLRFIFEHAFAEDDRSGSWSYPPTPRQPDVRECLLALAELPPRPDSLDLIEQVLTGALDASPTAPPGQTFGAGKRAYEIFHHELVRSAPRLWQRLFDAGRFTPPVIKATLRALPDTLRWVTDPEVGQRRPSWFLAALSPELLESVARVAESLAVDAAGDLTPESAPILINFRALRGSHFLVAAVRQHEAHRLGPLVLEGHLLNDGVYSAVLALARAREVEPDDPQERARLVAELQTFPAASLATVLPIALAGRRLLLDALRWEQAAGLVEALVGLAGLERDLSSFNTDVRNSPDPAEGVAAVAAVDAALAAAGESLARRILERYRKAKVGADNSVYLLQAAAGWNRTAVVASLAKHNQLSIKAYGLLPLDPARAADEVLERYLRFKESARESRRFGTQRQANHLAAVQAGLTNLAQRAGYADAVRLEWAMESRIGEDVAPVGRTWTLGDYEAELRLAADSGAPELEVRRNGKALKAVPPAVRRDQQYKAIQETLTQLRAQSGRIKETLEQCLAQGQTLSPADVQGLLRLPLGRSLLQRLILLTSNGDFRLLESDADLLQEDVRLAHPYHLFQAGQLSAWQQLVVQRRLVQPFKQAFRELYLLTPVERESGTYSTRFLGHSLDPRVASRLLQARGWQVESGDAALPFKVLPSAGLDAVFLFPDAGHYLAETETITSDRIYFLPRERKVPWHSWREGAAVSLEEVPPLLFSEVMRDADLVVSVAQRDGTQRLSEEGYQRRADLVRTLLDDLQLPGVRVEGHFAHVEGKLAHYRVHLASAAIQIAPGYALCVVPDRWGRSHQRLFLPYADEGDAKVSELLSKILLLLEDDKIKDASIRSQIQRSGPR